MLQNRLPERMRYWLPCSMPGVFCLTQRHFTSASGWWGYLRLKMYQMASPGTMAQHSASAITALPPGMQVCIIELLFIWKGTSPQGFVCPGALETQLLHLALAASAESIGKLPLLDCSRMGPKMVMGQTA
jgi:hypothetical protein